METFNYAPAALLAVLALAWPWWRIAGKRGYEVPPAHGVHSASAGSATKIEVDTE